MVDLSKLWSGRVGETELAPEVWAFVKSEDDELLPYDVEGTRLHARRLHEAGLAHSFETGSLIVARFMDPRAKMKDGTQMPYIVLSDPAGGRRVVWLARRWPYWQRVVDWEAVC